MIPIGGALAVFKGIAAVKSIIIFGGLAAVIMSVMFSCKAHMRTIEENAANKIQNQLLVEANANAVKRMEQYKTYSERDKKLALEYKGQRDGLRASQADYERQMMEHAGYDPATIEECPEECWLGWGGQVLPQAEPEGDEK